MAEEKRLRTAQVFDVNSGHVASAFLVGHLFYSQGQYTVAQTLFEGLQVLDSRNPFVHAMLGSIYQKQNAFGKALRHYSTAIQIFPSDIQSRVNRGEIYLRFGRFKEASADFKSAVDLDPEGKSASANRARFLAGLSKESLEVANNQGLSAALNAQTQLKKDLKLA